MTYRVILCHLFILFLFENCGFYVLLNENGLVAHIPEYNLLKS